MRQDSLTIALKEWALVQRALLDGTQIILLRKGGLIEETSQFELRAKTFLILPTYIHETERGGDIKPEYLDLLREEEANRPPSGQIRFECVCEAVDSIEVKNVDSLLKIADQTVWSETFIRNRMAWEPYKPMFAVVVRAYRLPEPIVIDSHADYFGCTSWVDLKEWVDIPEEMPVIGDKEFESRIATSRELLH
jgi:hypothetical protein